MSYWSDNPELLDEITTNFLPEPWKTQVEEGRVELNDIPEKIRNKAMLEGEQDFWVTKIDEARMRRKDEMLRG